MPLKASSKKIRLIVVIVLAILLIAAAMIWLSRQAGTLSYNFTPVQVGDIKQEVRGTGLVKAANDVALSFQVSGRVSQSLIPVGSSVKTGQVIATLNNADISAQLAQADAAVISAQAQGENARAAFQGQVAKLQDLKNGATNADLNLSQAQLASAQQAETDAQTNLTNVQAQTQINLNNQYSQAANLVSGAYSTAYAAVNTQLSSLFTDQQSLNPGLTIISSDSQLEINVRSQLVTIENSLQGWNTLLNNLDATNFNLTNQDLGDSLVRLNSLADFLRQVNTLLTDAVTTVTVTPDVLNTYKTSVNGALSAVNASILAINGQQQAIAALTATNNNLISQASSQLDQAKNSVSVAQKALALKLAGATKDQIAAQTAVVAQAQAGIDAQTAAISQAQANVQNIQAQLAKTVLSAPLDGIVSQNEAKVGEIVSPNVPIISIISQAKYQIETQIPESDIAHIRIGQAATVTMDAYGPAQEFAARVIAIDPASTVVNGVPSYKVTLEFNENYPTLKVGLSAAVQILTAENTKAIIIPSSAIIKRGSLNYAIVDNGTTTGSEKEITVGIISLDGQAEVSSGLSAGNRIANFGTPPN